MPKGENEERDIDDTRRWDLVPAALRERIQNAAPESAIARARRAGIDIAALAIRISTTTELERLAELDGRLDDVVSLRNAML